MFIDSHMPVTYKGKSVSYHAKYTVLRFLLSGKNGIRTLIAFIISAVSCFSINLFFYVIIPSMPHTTVLDYINCLNQKNYSEAAIYYTDIPYSKMINDDSINAAIKETYGNASQISIMNISPSENPKIYEVNLLLTHNGQSIDEKILLFNWKTNFFGLDRKWKVIFPFKIQDISVNGIDDSIIFVDGLNAGTIQNGILEIDKLICGKHVFKAVIPDMAESESTVAEIDENGRNITMDVRVTEEFRKSMETFINSFCRGWSEYCLTRDQNRIKPYLTDRVFGECINDTEMFNGSKYEKNEYTANFKDIVIGSKDSIVFNVDEMWHTREVITDSGVMFKINRRSVLERLQYIGWSYHIINESGSWKIDSLDQISFKQEIIE